MISKSPLDKYVLASLGSEYGAAISWGNKRDFSLYVKRVAFAEPVTYIYSTTVQPELLVAIIFGESVL